MYILGIEIVISPEKVNELLGFAGEEIEVERYYHAFQDCDFFRSAEGLEFLIKIHRNPNISGFMKPSFRDLNVRARVIHDLITNTTLPRDGHRDLVSCMDFYVMKKLYNGKMFNSGFLILGHMHDIGLCNKNLLYDTLISKIVEQAQIQL